MSIVRVACRICGKAFKSLDALRTHARMKHGPKNENNAALTCRYCGKVAEFWQSSARLYNGTDYGPIYICVPCDARVGCHKGTNRPLGNLANAELRGARRTAHREFDPIWQRGYMSRTEAYAELARRLKIPHDKCHISQFDVETCEFVIGICRVMGPEMKEKVSK